MANDKTDDKKEAPPAKESPVKKKRKLTSKQVKVQNFIERMSKPTPNYQFIQTYYLPRKAVKF